MQVMKQWGMFRGVVLSTIAVVLLSTPLGASPIEAGRAEADSR